MCKEVTYYLGQQESFLEPDVCVPYQYNELVEKKGLYKFYFSTSFSINETGGEWNGQ